MKNKLKNLKNLQDTETFAEGFLQMVFGEEGKIREGRNVILLQGDLGTGKTTFSQFLLKKLGAKGPFTSPTFVIMKRYKLKNDVGSDFSSGLITTGSSVIESLKNVKRIKNIYHLDCYRVDEESILDLGWEEIVADKNNLILVEWSEKIEKIWPKKYWLLRFEYGDDKMSRKVSLLKNK